MSQKRPYPYQNRVRDLLLQGKSIILQAPTGAGKTRAALTPFIEGFYAHSADTFPRQCLYSTPMRVLANQFVKEYKEYSESHKRLFQERPEMLVSIQTGERSTDPELMGNLVFTTIDQTLSNFLNVPYALSGRKGNVNAGAVVGSYLVFDEFHLFPHEHGMGALPATVQMLKLLRHTTPFVLMTATFSGKMLESLANALELDPKEQVVIVPPGELEIIDTRWGEYAARKRVFHLRRGMVLSADPVWDSHKSRSLAVCNTVDRAREIYDGLIAKGCRPIPFADESLKDHYKAVAEARDPRKREEAIRAALEQVRRLIESQPDWETANWVMLLHSRFELPHRAVKEEFARQMLGPVEERPWQLPSLILAATQVIEVGLNLTGENLHTEIAPASSVLQRAGRCARFPGEAGDIWIYAVPLNKKGNPNYLPYQPQTCDRTWDALARWDEKVVNFTAEQEIVNEAHGPDDEELFAKMSQNEGQIWAAMDSAVTQGETSRRRELIRDNVSSRTLVVYEPPEGKTEDSPYRLSGFSIYQGTLRGAIGDLSAWKDQLDLDWYLKYPIASPDQKDDSRAPTVYQWLSVGDSPAKKASDDISESLIFAIHPQLVAYDAERGFRFVSPEAESDDGGKYKPEPPKKPEGKKRRDGYRLESYQDHIRAMIRLYEQELRDRLAYVERRLEEHPDLRLQAGALDRAIRLGIALHDAGKLQAQWQEWARNYQNEINKKGIGEEAPEYLIAHTQSKTEEHREVERGVRPRRPPHAGESVLAGLGVLGKGFDGRTDLTMATATAIARHHSPQTSKVEAQKIHYHPKAIETLREALAVAGCPAEWADVFKRDLPAPPPLERFLLREGDWSWWLVYFLIVRAIRLTDGKSQEE